jgi:hypothetical protein
MPTWPSSLPGMNVGGYSEQARSGVVRSEVGAGPDYVRQRTSAVPVDIANSLQVTKAQRATLLAFHDTTCKAGSLSFDWEHPVTGDSVTMRWRSPPAISAITDDLFQARIEVEILPS